MSRCLLLAPLLLAGCFDLDVALDLKRSGASQVSFDFDLDPSTVATLRGFAPALVEQLKTQFSTIGEQVGKAGDEDGGRSKTTLHRGKDALGLTSTVAYGAPRAGEATMLWGKDAKLVDLGDGLWEVTFGDPDASGRDDDLHGMIEGLGALGGLGGEGGDGMGAILAALPKVTLGTTIRVPGKVEAIEPSTGTFSGSTATWEVAIAPSDLAKADAIGAARTVRFRTAKGFRFPDAIVAR